ncbi:MAG: GNAT family N-acetyltransferase [Sandaracinaceae bacterium]
MHLAFAHRSSPARHVHALDVDRLCVPTITFVSARGEGAELLGVGALRRIDPAHGELKSMHTAERARRLGVGRAIAEHLVALARDDGMTRVSLETGAQDAFAPARALYASLGFTSCEPFAEYTTNPYSVCMTRAL